MVRSETIVYGSTSLAVLLGLFTISLYFLDLIPGQATKGVLLFLRIGASLMVAIPIMVTQLLIKTPPTQRSRRVETVGLVFVLAVGLILSMLLLPQVYAGTSWGP